MPSVSNGPYQLSGFVAEDRKITATCDASIESVSSIALRFRVWSQAGATIIDETTAPVIQVTSITLKKIQAVIASTYLTTPQSVAWEIARTGTGVEAVLAFGTLKVEARGRIL